MKTAIGIILAIVLGAAAAVGGTYVVLDQFVATKDKAATSVNPADLKAPAEYKG